MATSWFRRPNIIRARGDLLFTRKNIYDMINKNGRYPRFDYLDSLISLYKQKIEVRKKKELV